MHSCEGFLFDGLDTQTKPYSWHLACRAPKRNMGIEYVKQIDDEAPFPSHMWRRAAARLTNGSGFEDYRTPSANEPPEWSLRDLIISPYTDTALGKQIARQFLNRIPSQTDVRGHFWREFSKICSLVNVGGIRQACTANLYHQSGPARTTAPPVVRVHCDQPLVSTVAHARAQEIGQSLSRTFSALSRMLENSYSNMHRRTRPLASDRQRTRRNTGGKDQYEDGSC
jgi:hypothetical protein